MSTSALYLASLNRKNRAPKSATSHSSEPAAKRAKSEETPSVNDQNETSGNYSNESSNNVDSIASCSDPSYQENEGNEDTPEPDNALIELVSKWKTNELSEAILSCYTDFKRVEGVNRYTARCTLCDSEAPPKSFLLGNNSNLKSHLNKVSCFFITKDVESIF